MLVQLKALLLLLEVVSCRGDGGKKNRLGGTVLECIVSTETIGLGRNIIEESLSVVILGLGMIL